MRLIHVPIVSRDRIALARAAVLLVAVVVTAAACIRPAADVTSPPPSSLEVSPSPLASPQETRPTASAAVSGSDGTTIVVMSAAADVAPAALSGLPWVAQATDALLVGDIGDRGRLSLPADRQVLAVTPSLVASSAIAPDGTSSEIYLSSRATGADVVPPFKVAGQVIVGRLAGTWIYATGFEPTRRVTRASSPSRQ